MYMYIYIHTYKSIESFTCALLVHCLQLTLVGLCLSLDDSYSACSCVLYLRFTGVTFLSY